MNKISKIFLGIIIVLVLVLGVMIYNYIDLRNSAKYSLDTILKQSEELQNAYIKIEELENKINTISNTINE